MLQDPAISKENIYNIDETGVMLSILDLVKVLVDKNNMLICETTKVRVLNAQ